MDIVASAASRCVRGSCLLNKWVRGGETDAGVAVVAVLLILVYNGENAAAKQHLEMIAPVQSMDHGPNDTMLYFSGLDTVYG